MPSFQSPIHRGMDCNIGPLEIDFSPLAAFSPLFIGEWIVTEPSNIGGSFLVSFQSPIHRGMDCNDGDEICGECEGDFQSPIHRGMDCNAPQSHGCTASATLSVPYSSGNGL